MGAPGGAVSPVTTGGQREAEVRMTYARRVPVRWSLYHGGCVSSFRIEKAPVAVGRLPERPFLVGAASGLAIGRAQTVRRRSGQGEALRVACALGNLVGCVGPVPVLAARRSVKGWPRGPSSFAGTSGGISRDA